MPETTDNPPPPDGPEARAQALIHLLKAECGELTESEIKLARAAAKGEDCDILRPGDKRLTPETDEDAWHAWGAHRTIRAEVLRTICVRDDAQALVDPRGVALFNARITGQLNLNNSRVPFLVLISWSAFDDIIHATNTRILALNMQGSRIPGLNADGLDTSGSLFLRNGFRSTGIVRLLGARIGDNLECDNGRFENPHGPALYGDRLRTTGGVFLRGRFYASSQVRLLSAHIGSDLDCSGGRFEGAGQYALDAAGLAVSGFVYLGDGFHASDGVMLVGARVGNSLDCGGGRFESSSGVALCADGLTTSGNVFLRRGFYATGAVRLMSARIGGILDCSSSQFENDGGYALAAERLEVSDNVLFRKGFHATGEVSLLGSRLGGALECDSSRFNNPSGRALNVEHAKVNGAVFLRAGFRASGEVRLVSARISGSLECTNGRFENTGDKALAANRSQLSGTLFLKNAAFEGEVDLTGCRIGSLHDVPMNDGRDRLIQPSEILLEDCRYDAIDTSSPLDAKSRLLWLANHDRTTRKHRPKGTPPDPGAYRWLATVLRKQGHERDADAVMERLGWRRWWPLCRQRLHGKNWDRVTAFPLFLLSGAYGLIVGHGYARFRPLYWLALFWVLGTWIFWANSGTNMQPTQGFVLKAWTQAQHAGWEATPLDPSTIDAWMNDPTVITDEQHRWISSYPKFSPWVYSIDAFLPLVDFHQEEYWTPRSGWWAKDWYLPFHSISGWIIVTLFAASFTRLARHD